MTTALTIAMFDVDGTLVDSNYLHTVAWWEAMAQAGYDVPMAAIHHVIGMGSDRLLNALLPTDQAGAIAVFTDPAELLESTGGQLATVLRPVG